MHDHGEGVVTAFVVGLAVWGVLVAQWVGSQLAAASSSLLTVVR